MMLALDILRTITEIAPALKIIADKIAEGRSSPISEVVDMATTLAPAAQAMMEKFDLIKSQTEATHPEVWAVVSQDWKASADKWLRS